MISIAPSPTCSETVPSLLEKTIPSLIDWRGMSSEEFDNLRTHFPGLFPQEVRSFYDPFVGNGEVWRNVAAKEKYVNDMSSDLMDFYEKIMHQDRDFFRYIEMLAGMWDLMTSLSDSSLVQAYNSCKDGNICRIIDEFNQSIMYCAFSDAQIDFLHDRIKHCLVTRTKRLRGIEYSRGQFTDFQRQRCLECVLKSAVYDHVMSIYNASYGEDKSLDVACFYFLREYCVRGLYRRGANNSYATPFGGLDLIDKQPDRRIPVWKSKDVRKHLKETVFTSFKPNLFLKMCMFREDDFIFAQPPVQEYFSPVYSENYFSYSDHKELADFLISEAKCRWMVVLPKHSLIESFYHKRSSDVLILYYKEKFKSRLIGKSGDFDNMVIINF